MIYLDNAATSWPKPEETLRAMEEFMRRIGANPGRSGHRLSIEAAWILLEARELLAQLFGISDPQRIIFTKNATEALNLVIFGLLKPGDHVITSSMEHNSVMRPLRAQERRGVELTVIRCSAKGELDPEDVRRAIKGNTKLIILTHASNVTGTIFPASEVGEIAREEGVLFCLDAAQTAGALPIDVEAMNVDILVFTGHKSLYGPQGTGGFYLRSGVEEMLEPLMRGGTGSRSEFEEQPDFLPDKYESGTPNAVGIAGLAGGVRFVLSEGVEKIREKERRLTRKLIEGLKSIPGVRIYGPEDEGRRIGIVSLNIEGISSSELAMILDEEFGVLTRPGLHCAPSAHRTIGTFPQGALRMSVSYFNTEEEIEFAVQAVGKAREKALRYGGGGYGGCERAFLPQARGAYEEGGYECSEG